MDILCTRCGEPWDTYSLVDDMTTEEATKLKAGKGCPCCIGKNLCKLDRGRDGCLYYLDHRCEADLFQPINNDSRLIQKELATILGDDIDGLAGTMEDFGLT